MKLRTVTLIGSASAACAFPGLGAAQSHHDFGNTCSLSCRLENADIFSSPGRRRRRAAAMQLPARPQATAREASPASPATVHRCLSDRGLRRLKWFHTLAPSYSVRVTLLPRGSDVYAGANATRTLRAKNGE